MNVLLLTTILFGAYDLLVKLSSSGNSPGVNAFFVQLASVATIGLWIIITKRNTINLSPAIITPILAGTLIGIALILLFFLLSKSDTESISIIPTTLIGRNLILIIGSAILLNNNLNVSQIVGVVLSLSGIYLINR